ncbi:Class V chitinase CHIT5a [Stylosanthes scabra]|uniref:Class V chitinase CHIT5a n=1 Tax=Stylosanthes scabra TaxID=79078 RepID=A0ABU6UM27_9FABA|nr:Class V chitinase CHIT5a [Stylosanthes scabra]
MTTTMITFFTTLLVILMSFQTHASTDSFQHPIPSPYYSGSVRAGYWPSGNSLSPSSIDTRYFTHIYYAFIEPEPNTFNLIITPSDQNFIPEFINGLSSRNPPVKTILSIGGGSSNATLFSLMASTVKSREAFINSTIQVARQYGFDGVDLDWEFPNNKQDMANLALLFKEWHQALVLEAKVHRRPRLLLTAAVYYAHTILFIGPAPRDYPAQAIKDYLDWASPMCFDYHGAWDNITGYNAALFDPTSKISTQFGLGSWIKSGVPPSKLVFGLPLYGRAWKLQDPKVHGHGAPAVGAADGTDGTMNYDDILEFNKKNKATVVFDRSAVSYYTYAGNTWISYDDGPSITRKVQYAKSLGLKGYFFWEVGSDKNWSISRQASSTWGY